MAEEKKTSVNEKIVQFLDSLGIKIRTKDAEETEEEKADRLKKEAEAKKKEEEENKKTKDEDPLPKKVFDEGMAGVDERLTKIENLLKELLSEETEDEAKETEEEKAKREAEEKKTKDAEEAEAKEKEKEKKEVEDSWPEFLSHAEVIVPGIAESLKLPEKDHRKTMDALTVEVLEKAVVGNDKEVLEGLFKGRDVKKMTTDALSTAFLAASQIVSIKRNGKIQNADGRQLAKDALGKHKFSTAQTVKDINDANKKAYGR